MRSRVIGPLVKGALLASASYFSGVTFVDSHVQAQDEGLGLEEIFVTARRRSESIQDVPDSITAFSAETIERAGIDDVAEFVELTPNVTYREAFRAGVTFITIRGITTGQQGWPPVTYIVDGVPAGSLDAINQGTLVEVERIEVLKGPQSALYGAGAIAGAINVITKAPTDDFEYGAQLSYGNGNDIKAQASASGPLVEGKVRFRVDGYFRDTDGIIETNDGDGVDFETQYFMRGRLIFDFDALTIDLRAKFSDIEAGAAFQEFLPPGEAGLALLDDFDNSPGIERGILGQEDRRIIEISSKIDYEFDSVTLTSISSYSDINQDLFGTTTWQRPPAAGFCGPVGGPGEPPDCFQTLGDDVRVFTQDLRVASNGTGPLRWLFGASYLDRRFVNLLRVGSAALDVDGVVVEGPSPFLNRTDLREDQFFGLYGQISYDITEDLEFTFAGRYDQNDYSSTQFASTDLNTIVPLPSGDLSQDAKDSLFQPKVQLSYDWTDDLMVYATIARGFRTGFFNTGNRTFPESTWNYEVGFKSTLWDGRASLNGAAFHIDYSDQQFSRIVPEPPFLAVENIEATNINGFELEAMANVADGLNLSAGIGFTDAEVTDGFAAPFTPKLTLNLTLDYLRPITETWDLAYRVDYRHQSSQFLERSEQFRISGKDYLNMRLSLQNDQWRVSGFVNNLTDERQANEINNLGFGFIRVPNKPRSYGVEVAVQF